MFIPMKSMIFTHPKFRLPTRVLTSTLGGRFVCMVMVQMKSCFVEVTVSRMNCVGYLV